MKKQFLNLLCLVFFFFFYAKTTLACACNSQISTMEEGVLKVAVTGVCMDDSPRHNCWIYRILSTFAEKNNLSLQLIKVNFDRSWELANANKVDIVATGVTPLPERFTGDATYSHMYSIVKRGIKIKREDEARFKGISDFRGYSLTAVKGMTSEIDLRNRTLEGIDIIIAETFQDAYDLFNTGKVAGIAEGFYFFPEDSNEFNNNEETLIIDIHDLVSGKTEGNSFVVRNRSTNLVKKLNDHIKCLGLPNRMP